MKLFDTETRSLKTVEPHFGDTIRFYTCGPTIYDYAHIGNLRTFVAEDLMKRAMLFFGLKVRHVMNLTDVDDKTIRGAIREKKPLKAYTEPFKVAFFEDLKRLNVLPADRYPAATDCMNEMIVMIHFLIKKGAAYKGQDGSIYFSIAKFPQYGKLSHLKLDELEANKEARLQQDEYTKDHLSDFVLWKAYDEARDGGIFWESPFGKGRPGWHIECSAMAAKELGEEIDIHAGGVDLIFPHHENEIAQSEACSGHIFSKMWVHVEHLLVDGKKMSKSLGNFYTLRDLLDKGYAARSIRFALLQTHYRMQMNFTFEVLQSAKNSLQRLDDFIVRLEEYKDFAEVSSLQDFATKTQQAFDEAIAQDLNTSEALACLFDFVREMNARIDRKVLTKGDIEAVFAVLKRCDEVLGVLTFEKAAIPEAVQKLVQERTEVRAQKNFKRSDEIRNELAALGFVVEDTPSGPRVKRL